MYYDQAWDLWERVVQGDDTIDTFVTRGLFEDPGEYELRRAFRNLSARELLLARVGHYVFDRVTPMSDDDVLSSAHDFRRELERLAVELDVHSVLGEVRGAEIEINVNVAPPRESTSAQIHEAFSDHQITLAAQVPGARHLHGAFYAMYSSSWVADYLVEPAVGTGANFESCARLFKAGRSIWLEDGHVAVTESAGWPDTRPGWNPVGSWPADETIAQHTNEEHAALAAEPSSDTFTELADAESPFARWIIEQRGNGAVF